MSDFKDIIFEIDDGVATLTLNRPDALNALTFDMMYEVQEALKLIEADSSIRALILTGAGRAFCSGQDLRNRPDSAGEDKVQAVMDCYFGAMDGLRKLRVPVITAVNGTAAGAGFSFALVSDVIMAARSAKFIQVFSRIGLIPDMGSTYLLPQLIGRARTLKVMMTNEPIMAETALEWGLISDCVADEDLLPMARDLAAKLAQGPTKALVATRAMVDEAEDNDFATHVRRELEVQMDIAETADATEGVAAFVEKRQANFTGT
ncbi:MAG: crotonase [Rhodospirillaceae bacterium]|jgi:2-(1,2-epoxy-1,2-dihydrophenyl)acetyl-CoA isomerase|nr:crotonase [Rhodospirillaceae bacterium]MBT4487032.1 crotonase [Rhodospirillaceae bacterium]MBT5896265.1 crotonase [Rhodospirillaceae bacterium]MBT7755742.1 crotonase [Rhodospirillaceae bacterium]